MLPNARKAIRRFCLDCQGGHVLSVRVCTDAACILYPLRLGDAAEEVLQGRQASVSREAMPLSDAARPMLPFACLPAQDRVSPPERADLPEQQEAGRPERLIRLFCLACVGNRLDVRACDAKTSCALWSFRFGVSPATFRRVIARRLFWKSRLTLPGLAL